jgi:hypothetical protein
VCERGGGGRGRDAQRKGCMEQREIGGREGARVG